MIREDLLNALPDAFALLDVDWRYMLVNRATAELLRTTPQHLLGRVLWETWPTGLDSARPALTRARDGRSPFEAETTDPDARRRLRYRFTFPEAGTLVQVVEIAPSTRLDTAGALERYDALLGMIGHELRNSFSSIKHGIELLHQEAANRAPQPALDALGRRAVHFSRIVDDVMDASAFLRGDARLTLSNVRLADVVASALDAVDKAAHDKKQRVARRLEDADLVLEADAIRLERALINVLGNAVKYSEAGSTITLIAGREQDQAFIRVQDQGIGIARDELPHVCDLFFRGARHSSESGLGIGLAVAQRLVKLHGGTLSAKSDGPGRGSEFTIRLPVGSIPPQEPAP